ncbi:permease [Rothia sp. HMSC058E10]|uniref:FtsX-like permease family protein n=2 Tax=unclassified Rothia (in: high G+C Gram-positive bacteria) TaxID=2689056 RepID=UPI0008A36CCA|nr:FtsX-like permease family protein [Rothia sp. HMSC058E10]OFN18041.1 permease [Rothia sp. HMSC058E10]
MQTFKLLARRTLPTSQAILPVLAFAASAALFLLIAGGIHAFYLWLGGDASTATSVESGPGTKNTAHTMQPLYLMLAWISGFLLLTPLFTLGASAARLSARRRDDRLTTLRLLGASTRRLTLYTMLDSVIYAAVGFVLGFIVYLILVLPFGMLRFQNIPLGPENMLLPLPIVLVCGFVSLIIAATSSLFGLSKVAISPLGVRTRSDKPSLGKRALILGCVLLVMGFVGAIASQVIMNLAADSMDSNGFVLVLVITIMFGLPILLTMLAVDLIGGFVVGLYARIRVRTARTPATLLAYRSILESPRAAWRQVSGVAMTTFIAAFVGPILGMVNSAPGVEEGSAESYLIGDILQGLVLVLFLSYLLVALSALLNQSAAIYERSSLYSSLRMMGTEAAVLKRSRRIVVFGPLLLVSCMSAVVALPLFVLLLGSALTETGLLYTAALVFGSIAMGLGLVFAALAATGPVMEQVSRKPVSAV